PDMGDLERLCDRVLVVDHGQLAYAGSLPGLAATVGARRVLVVDLAAPCADLSDLPYSEHLASEGSGMRERLAFDAERTTAAALWPRVSQRCEVRDLSIEEPDIEDVVRRIYQTRADGWSP
ncbi:MAG: methionine ABC transporter ATP-binding protein, partial [Actinomycetota bacterium]|nr:methionine ABC transporter ATP-binding protein [Actinomycetota bacterium]